MTASIYQILIIAGSFGIAIGIAHLARKYSPNRALDAKTSKKDLYLRRLIIGEISLLKTFWIWFFLGFIVYYTLVAAIAAFVFSTVLSLQTIIIINSLYLIFSSGAVWKSANKYKGKKVFGMLAQAFVVWVWLWLGLVFVFNTFGLI
ncbi:MAG: hypothetical protein IIA70_03380 [Proteobacteria bacterium]|nr:hypothetical protein [Pseudomonadota bacterium]